MKKKSMIKLLKGLYIYMIYLSNKVSLLILILGTVILFFTSNFLNYLFIYYYYYKFKVL